MYKKIFRSMCILSIFTLILSSVLILFVSYSSFNTHLKSEMKNETLLTADFLNESGSDIETLRGMADYSSDRRISLISSDGKVLYDNDVNVDTLDDHNNRPEIIEARKSGMGFSERYSVTTSQKFYYCAVKLNNGSILRIATAYTNIFSMFTGIIIVVLFIAFLVYVLSVKIAASLTDKIIKPIEEIRFLDKENYDDVYEEIQPFLNRISRQNNEIQHQMDRTKAHKARLQTIADNMNEGLIIVDDSFILLSANTTALEILGLSLKPFTKQPFDELTQIPDLISAARRSMQGKKINFNLIISDNTYQVFCSPVFEKDIVKGVIILLFDVSEKAKAEQIRKEFTANVSHELKTPLTTISGYAQLIKTGLASSEDIQKFALKIENESAHLLNLIDDTIKLSKLDEQPEILDKQNVSLKNIALNVAESLKLKADKNNITITVEGTDSIIFANQQQVGEIIYNLCENAVKYNKRGGDVSMLIGDKSITVSDTGIGIPEDSLERIFERFYRADKSHSKKITGTGLGLSIAKHAAQINNATIEVFSKENLGSTFKVVFH
ncbi:MAG: ATP-binding protein [Bacillota bacterium]|nr:ATP-binding protein [Bacillota bacterium]